MAVNSGDGGPKAVRKRGEKHRLQPRTARNVQISACHGPSARDDLVAAKLITLDNEVIFAFCNLVRFGPRAVRTKSRRDSDLVPWVSMFTRHEQRTGGVRPQRRVSLWKKPRALTFARPARGTASRGSAGAPEPSPRTEDEGIRDVSHLAQFHWHLRDLC